MMIWIATIGAFIGGVVVGFLLTIRWINSVLKSPDKIMKIAGIQGEDAKKALVLLFGAKGGKKDEE
ncbi:hypothetical protein ES703_09853 [subsurface metagenome]